MQTLISNNIKKNIENALKYTSRTKIGMCKNEGCYNRRRPKSAFCEECSKKHNN